MSEGLFVPGTKVEASYWPEEIDHLSASSVSMLIRCPEQFRRVYIKGQRRRPSAASIWGKSDHAAVAYNYEQKIDSGEDLPVREVMEKFVERAEHFIEEGGDEIDWREENPTTASDKIRRQGSDLVACYQAQVAPVTMPELVEEPFRLEDPLFPVPLVGYTDLIANDWLAISQQLGSNRRLIERKTVAMAKRKPDPEWAVQARLYQLIHKLPLEFQLSVKSTNPKVLIDPEAYLQNVRPAAQTKAMVRGMMETLKGYYNVHGPDNPWPGYGQFHTWACGYCGFRPDCYWWKE
jgi:hypothetical protein